MTMLRGLLTAFLSNAMAKNGRECSKRWGNTIAFLLLGGAYILGCIGLYYYLLPWAGVAFSLFGVGVALLLTSGIFYLTGWVCQRKKSGLSASGSLMESAFAPEAGARMPVGLLVAVGAIALYFTLSKNKES